MRPVAGLPLIHVERPRYHSAQKFAKTSFDIVFATMILIFISPVPACGGGGCEADQPGSCLVQVGANGLGRQTVPYVEVPFDGPECRQAS